MIQKEREVIIYVVVEIGKKLIELWENRKNRKDNHDSQRDSTKEREG